MHIAEGGQSHALMSIATASISTQVSRHVLEKELCKSELEAWTSDSHLDLQERISDAADVMLGRKAAE